MKTSFKRGVWVLAAGAACALAPRAAANSSGAAASRQAPVLILWFMICSLIDAATTLGPSGPEVLDLPQRRVLSERADAARPGPATRATCPVASR